MVELRGDDVCFLDGFIYCPSLMKSWRFVDDDSDDGDDNVGDFGYRSG